MNESNLGQAHPLRCIDIGGSKIVAADVSSLGDINNLVRVRTPVNDFEQFTESLRRLCSADLSPISISIAGVIHPLTGVARSANIPCITGRVLSSKLSACLRRPVNVINDANAFALAEAGFGQAKDHAVVLAVILGTGVGGGIVVNGQLLTGADGTAGEWGHGAASAVRTGVELPMFACNCGQLGCVDTLGGARGLERLYGHFGSSTLQAPDYPSAATGPASAKSANRPVLDSHSIVTAWLNKDALAVHVVDVWLDVVGSALAAAVNLLGASIVAVGGGLASSRPLMEALDKEVRNRSLTKYPVPLLYSAASGPERGLLGAAIYAKSQLG